MPAWLGALLGVPALIVAAKAHGRQVRLEREAAGYHAVQFGGSNPAFVERLWRRDRIRFWTSASVAAVALGASAFFLAGDIALALVAAFLWAPIVGFFYAGLRGFAEERGKGGIAWWALAASLTSASILAALW